MKNKRILSWLLAAAMALSLLPTTALAADFPGNGSGTADDPYIITTAAELDAVRENLSGYYRLGNDIDLSETDYASAWTPIGSYVPDASDPSGEAPDAAHAFTGTFDGNGHKITGLTIPTGAMCVGLFGIVANGTVEDLTIEDATVSGNTMAAAAIGYAYNSTVDNVDLTGTNTITGVLDNGTAPNMVAGVVGAGMDSIISDCDVTGATLTMATVVGASALGYNVHDIGLVGGGLEGCNLADCSANDSSVTADGVYCFGIGGLSGCAISAESVTGCTVTGVDISVGGNAYLVGGLTGYTGQDGDNAATQVSDCSASTAITVGDNSSRIGGLIGGGFYLEMYKAYYPVPSRFDLAGCTTDGTITAGNDSEAVGTIVGYACLDNVGGCTSAMTGSASDLVGEEQPAFADGDGTEGNPYQISNAAQLYAMRYDLDANYRLTTDIDLADQLGGYYSYVGWNSIGILTYSDVNMQTGAMDTAKAFSGAFDGDGHTISNVMSAANHQDLLSVGGVFACVTGTVQNLKVENVTVTGGETNMTAGGVVGYAMNGSEISNVTLLTGANTITGINCVGGIVGGSEGAALSNCMVEGVDIVVIGDNDFNAANSETKGRIIQRDVAECGGLVVGGGFGGSVKNCTATGTVTANGNEPVGLGGIGGCLQCMSEISGNTADVTITTNKGGHAIGGLCGYAGTGDDGTGTVAAACEISDCHVTVNINAPGATHVGGLVGTGLYFYGMEDRFNVTGCTVTGTITAGTDAASPYGVTTPGAVAGRAVDSSVDGCTFTGLMINGEPAANKVGTTSIMYESADQYESEGDTDGGTLLYGLTNTYQPLFEGATFNEEYSDYWHDYCAAIVGEDNAADTAAAMKASVGGTLYGQAAVDAYQSNPESTQFYCGFTGEVAAITFNGAQISGYDENGAELFSHAYRYVGYQTSTDETRFGFYIFESLDGNADEYKYFAMCPDTPDTTHHIEFRYGGDLDELLKLYEGEYAYWLAAGIPSAAMSDPEESEIEEVIALFCLENMDYTAARTSSSLSQISDLVGTWDYYINGQAQPDMLYFVVDANGNGHSYYQGQHALDYQVFVYDNDGSASVKSGIYVARDDEPEAAKYTITTNSAGKTIFTLTGEDEGQAFTISYVKRTSSNSSNNSSSSGSAAGATIPVASGSGTANLSASVSGRIATIKATDAQIKEIASGTQAAGMVKIDVSALKVDTVVIPAAVVSAVNGASGSTGFEVALPTGTVTLDKTALSAVAGKGDIKLSVETVSNTELSDTQKSVLGTQMETALVVDVNVYAGGAKISTFGNGKISVSVPYTLKSGESADSITVWFLKDDGTIEPKNATYNAATGCVEFTTEHLSQYLIVRFPFTDVADDAWYYGSVAYAYNNALFSGTGGSTFSPDVDMTRQMIWMVLARMDGETPVDMNEARAWAIQNGISDGTSPTNSINREQMVTILHRYAQYKSYDVSAGQDTNILSYGDALTISEYAVSAMQWACGAGLVQGSGNHLMPFGGATRAQVAAILQRFCRNVAK